MSQTVLNALKEGFCIVWIHLVIASGLSVSWGPQIVQLSVGGDRQALRLRHA